jgi:hypothetical protein
VGEVGKLVVGIEGGSRTSGSTSYMPNGPRGGLRRPPAAASSTAHQHPSDEQHHHNGDTDATVAGTKTMEEHAATMVSDRTQLSTARRPT